MDRDGKWAETLWDIANVVMDVKSAKDNFNNGEIVSGLVDVGATVLDCIASIAPGIPGGVGTVVKAARSTDKVTDAVKAVDKGIETTKTVDKGVESAKAVEYGTSAAKQGNKINISPENKIDRSLLDAPTKPGQAPTFKSDNTSVEIHHVGQNPEGPFIEMHWKDHRGNGNNKGNHPIRKTLIDRKDFRKKVRDYWINEYNNLKQQ